jgi:hypothetical protein
MKHPEFYKKDAQGNIVPPILTGPMLPDSTTATRNSVPT